MTAVIYVHSDMENISFSNTKMFNNNISTNSNRQIWDIRTNV